MNSGTKLATCILCAARTTLPFMPIYVRSIREHVGRSYSNLAMAYVQTGKYIEAIKFIAAELNCCQTKRKRLPHGIGLVFYIAKSSNIITRLRPINGRPNHAAGGF